MMFFKMQGLGNDYVYIDCTNGREPKEPSKLAVQLSNRHFGVGSDGLILICDSKIADLKMRMFNQDGSEAQMCGNGIRCVAKLVYDLGLIKENKVYIETLAGIKELNLNVVHGKVKTVEVDMGEPILEKNLIPVKIKSKEPILEDKNKETKKSNLNNSKEKESSKKIVTIKQQIEKQNFTLSCVSIGNPHAVTFVEKLENYPVKKYGPILEKSNIFPERANIEFVEVIDKNHIQMRVWERGAGETLACGTGACASVVASCLQDYTERKVNVKLLGGDLEIEWKEDNHVYMAGPAVTVFKGEWIND